MTGGSSQGFLSETDGNSLGWTALRVRTPERGEQWT